MALRDLAEERAEITLVAPDVDFTYKPLVVEEPFSGPHDSRRALGPIVESFGARFVQQPVTGVAPDRHVVLLGDGSELGYQVLIVCVGARGRPAFTDAVTFDAGPGALEFENLPGRRTARSQQAVTFVVPWA